MKSLFRIINLFSLFVLAGFLISCGPEINDFENSEVTVVFYANNGTDDCETQKLEPGISAKLRKNSFVYEGYNFIGWSLSAGSSQVKYADETTVAIKENLSLYAVWQSEDNTATITFWANRNEDDTDSVIQCVEKDTSVNLRANSFTYEGYSFAGWISSVDHASADYVDKASISIGNDINLYALWIETSNTGTVILHSNTEDDETISLYFSYEDYGIHNLADDIFEREGYRIEGWSENPNAKPGLLSGNYIQPGLSWMFKKETLHYYCIWQKESAYTITFNPNYEGANDTPVEKEFERTNFNSSYASFKIFEPFLFTREGYELVGWSTRSNPSAVSSDVTYHGAESSSFSHDTTLYAVWLEKDSSNLIHYTYYKNDGNAGTESEERIVVPYKKSGYKIGLADAVFAWDGMAFDGWKKVRDKADNSKTTYCPLYQTKTYSDSSDESYYAIWHVEKPEITFKANFEGSEYQDIVVSVSYKENQLLPECQWTREGYGFVGWSKNPDSSTSNALNPGSRYTPEENIVYYAIWQKNPVITFHANYEGAVEEDKTQVVPYNQQTDIADIQFSREGYFFMGYTTSPTSSYSPKKPGDKVTLTKDTDYYAVWAKTHTIIYNSNYKSGQQSQVSDSHPEGQKFYTRDECPFEAPEGYYFAGWSSVNDSTYNSLYLRKVTSYTFGSSADEDYNVYATWFRYQNVHLISNYDGTGSRDKVIDYKIKIGDKIAITQELVNQFTAPQGKSFWCFGQNGVKKVPATTASNVYFELGNEFSYDNDDFNGDFNLYAQWRGPLTLTLNANFEGSQPASKVITVPFGTHLTSIELPEEWNRSEQKYHFWGWAANANQSTNSPPSDSYVIFDNNSTIYAIWQNPVKYTYHYNYGDSQEVYEDFAERGYDYFLIDNMFALPEGKKFKEWCTKPNTKSGVARSVGSSISAYYNKTDSDYYAIWIDE